MIIIVNTSMSVLLTFGRKCTLAVSHAAPWRVKMSMPTGQTDGRTDIRYITISAIRGKRN